MDGKAIITPFWHRIPHFFGYALGIQPLIVVIALAVASYFLVGWLMEVVYSVIAIKYASEALQHTVSGNLTPPRLSLKVINENLELPFKLLGVYLIYFYMLGKLLAILPPFLAIPLLVMAILLLPAVIISLVVTEEISHALNPINWFGIALRIGWPYLIMFLFLGLFGLVQGEFAEIILSQTSSRLYYPFSVAIDTYFMIVIFHLMGYVVLQYHEELGEEAPEGLNSVQKGENNPAHTTPLLERFIEERNIPAAIGEISSLIEASPDDMELRRKAYVLLVSNGEEEWLERYAPHYFGLLAARKRYEDAAKVYMDSHERGKPFVPVDPEHYLPVMKSLRSRRHFKQAVLLVQGFHKRFPNDPNIPEIYLEMAKVLSEELQRDDLAKSALSFVIKGFPEANVVPQVEAYLKVLQRLGTATA